MPRKPKPETLPPIMRRLIEKRLEAGLSRRELASSLGYSIDAIYGWEVGTIYPTFQSLMDWTSFFGMEIDAVEACQ